jgi:ribonuclease P protein component
MDKNPQSLGKLEKIKSKILIDSLFDRRSKANQSFLVYPIKTIFSVAQTTTSQRWPEIMVSVSAKKFKRAVDRNLIKRRLKEAYRRHKAGVTNRTLIAFIYVANEMLDYATVEKAMIRCLKNLKPHNETA